MRPARISRRRAVLPRWFIGAIGLLWIVSLLAADGGWVPFR